MALIPGNLLSENTQTLLTDVSGWSATGATIERTTTDLTGAGPHSMLATTASADDTVITTVDAVPVTPGAFYRGYGWTLVPDRTADVTIEIHWFDADDTEVGTPAAEPTWPISPPDPLAAQRPFVTGRAPAGATSARLTLRTTATDSGQYVYWDEMFLGLVTSNPEGNLLDYDEYSFETSDAGYSADAATLGREFVSLPGVNDGAFMLGITPDDMGVLRVSCPRLVPITGGDTYSVGALVLTRANGDPNAWVTARPRVRYYDAEQAFLTDDNPEPFYSHPNSNGDTFSGIRFSRAKTSPPDAAYAQIAVEIQHAPPTTATSYLLDQVTMAPGGLEYTLSVSNTRGYVHLVVEVLPPEESTRVTVWRVDESGAQNPVRGYGGDLVRAAYTPGTKLDIEDYEAPVGGRVWYRVVWETDAGVQTATLTTTTVTAPVIAETDYVWVKSPGLPALNRMVMMAEALSWKREARSVQYAVRGRRAPVVVSEVRASRTGTMYLHIWDRDANDAFDRLLDPGTPLLLQAAPGHGVNGNLYLSVGDVSVEPINWRASDPGWRWELDVTEIDRPEGGIQGSQGRTWQNVFDDHASWLEVFETYGTWEGVFTGVPGE